MLPAGWYSVAQPAIWLSISSSARLEVVHRVKLVAQGADPACRDEYGMHAIAIMVASANDRLPVVKYFLTLPGKSSGQRER